jgi:superfamily II DNA/RNA helicase
MNSLGCPAELTKTDESEPVTDPSTTPAHPDETGDVTADVTADDIAVETITVDPDAPAVAATTFRDLGVHPEICDALERGGITTPFAIQEMTLSVALVGTDLIGQARTGTGKTLAFGIPVIQRSVSPRDPDYVDLPQGKPQALIVAPTRELALQVSSDLELASKDRGMRVLTVYGGVGYDGQLDALETGVDIVVGTPGRLIDLANRRALDLGHVHALVLDEADEMLDLGFLPDVERLLSLTPETRQTMLFSATMPSAIVSLARTHMRSPMNIRAESSYDTSMVPATAQFIYQAHDLDKPEIIGRVLQAQDAEKIIVFTRTKRQAQRVADDLAERGFPTSPLHGDMAQVAREKALTKFREDKIRVLVATDVAARGIDVRGVSHVINYTCPEDDKTYVHRIGRTGRAGATGTAITFVDWADLHRWKMINKTLDLPFDEPQETYSTSEHLYHDQGIAPGTKGRIVDPAPVERKPREGDRGSRDRDRDRKPREATRNRSRSRTRGGQGSDGAGAAAGETTAPVTAGEGQEAHAGGSSGSSGSSGSASGTRNRRRRRRGGSGGASAEGSAAPAAE